MAEFFLFVAIENAATKQTSIRTIRVADCCAVSSATLDGLFLFFTFFLSLSLSLTSDTSVRLLVRCARAQIFFFFFSFFRFQFQPSLPSTSPSSSNNASTSSFLLSSFSFSLILFFPPLLFKRRNSVQNCPSFFALDKQIRSSSSPPSSLTSFLTL